MSINNVVLKDNYSKLLGTSELPFVLASDGSEVIRFSSSSPRQSLSIVSKQSDNSVHINTKDGFIYLTTKRFIYITASQGDVSTFSVDLTLSPRLQFSHELKSPWFGPNYWEFIFFSTPTPSIASDGFPKNEYFKGQVKFNDGGLFQFVEVFNSILNDAVNNTQIDDQLPSYSEI
ncbi:hypothetical protein CANTEDRAFT_99900 [Yamadazyma tenuis ATCC 10573]|uniref:GRAM domain-containing protein n=1 Tax=Candida tenuis (strain ATCC 10573 / BCRC 21748 / CBS 615 / JCM 9827 / NBRC 10315 / NRRL Y-1498 / VKM Y-70) TaxID=590646 RepID=G3BEA0_CANTC|nr:uncharacterized protein CANTEDRAFT_99900 [Yamadazyma tenuis ATCC 10573]EGV60499.1 hypothetical protein CANTEDRAFT_99900 [Yamadazyma tenuis ATCC 10573]